MDIQRVREQAIAELRRKIEVSQTQGNGIGLERLLHELQAHELELQIQNEELRKTQLALERSRDAYAELFDCAPIGYLILSKVGLVTDINLTGSALLNRERKQIIGYPFEHFLAGEDRSAFRDHLLRARQERRKAVLEVRLTVGGGREALPVQLCTVPVADPADGLLFRTALIDIGERVAAEAALRETHEQLERRVVARTAELQAANEGLQAEIMERNRLAQELRRRMEELAEIDRQKDEFLAMLAHELRNPLAAIVNASELLRRGGGEDPNIRARICQVIRNQANHLTHLLDDLLDVARVTRGTIRIHMEAVDLGDIVVQAVETHRAMLDGCRHRLAVELPSRPLRVYADPIRCAQIVSNLIHNAAKFTDPGGDITVSLATENGEATVRVKDNGIGIPPESLARVFSLFTQEDQSLSRSRGGLGIGLSLVRKLVDMHGGRVEARSDGIGRGSEFTIRLPLAEPQEDPESLPAAAEAARRVLIVDGHRAFADALAALLRNIGYAVQVCYTGDEGLAAVRREPPDITLLDIGLPNLDGWEIARRLRADSALPPRGRLIALRGYGRADDSDLSAEAGSDQPPVKPMDLDRLLELLAG
jgi:signal transduction histidine kinase/CheY-like chemotaxis protein